VIVARSPLRVPFGGGGTDLPSYYKKKNGYVISAAINKYVFISLGESFSNKYILNYSQLEKVKNIKDIKHPLFRETLKFFDIKKKLHLSSHADIPSGTGLGSSGCFAVTLVNILSRYKKLHLSKKDIAEIACNIEIKKLKEPVGKQDQFVASFGGFNEYIFDKDGSTNIKKLNIKKNFLQQLQNNLFLYFTGYTRSSYKILKVQDKKTKSMDKNMIKNLDLVKEYGYQIRNSLINSNIAELAMIMKDHWEIKKKRSSNISNKRINYLYDMALDHGALSGKLIGAGGGGFLLFICNNKSSLEVLEKKGLKRVKFEFDFEGTKIL
jgi:D-glycero-alpha-D-manno-heptose-7-phosphate kinase